MAPHCHIILVDDEISVAELLKAVIKRVCPTVNISLATNGHKALQLFEQFGADLIMNSFRLFPQKKRKVQKNCR